MDYINNIIENFKLENDAHNNSLTVDIINKDTIIIEQDNNYKLIKISYSDLQKNYKIKNWKRNRPADRFRVNEIYEVYKESNIKLLPGILYVWFYNNVYYIYDGLHRYEALKKLNNDSINILLFINLSNDEKSIINDFITINKSVAIPSLYIEDTDNIKKEVCQSVAEQLCKNYQKFISTSNRPHTYNFNRDNIIDWISTFNINFKIKDLSYIIYKILQKLNEKAKQTIIENKLEIPIKCKQYNFYLFHFRKSYIKSEIEKIINESF